jgi:HAD superfamily hydrolase (TIGR01509 family)
MDGVLVDSEPLHFEALRAVLAADGLRLDLAEYEGFIGATTEETLTTLIERHALRRSHAQLLAHYDEAILRVFETPREPLPGVRAVIARARSDGLRIAVASSSRRLWIDATLRSLGLAQHFDAIVAGDDVVHGKPDPAIYLLAAERLATPPEHCLAIEDSPKGVRSAYAAGMRVLGVRTPYTAHLALDGAERIVNSLTEIERLA